MASLFSMFNKKNKQLVSKGNNQNLVNLFTPFFSEVKNANLNEVFMSAVNTHAKHFGKIKPIAVYKDGESNSLKDFNRLLQLEPNHTTNAATFYETLCKNYYLYNYAFVFLERDMGLLETPVKAMWILEPDINSMETAIINNKLYITFTLDGEVKAASCDDILMICRDADPNDLFSKGNKAIEKILKVMTANYEGIEQAIKVSSFLRFIITSSTPLKDEVKKQKAQAFARDYLTEGNGVIYSDVSANIHQITSDAKYADYETMNYFKNSILNYLGISEKIIQADYNENEWQAYYESSIEPLMNKLKQELERKVLTKRQYAQGVRFEISSDKLQTASLQTRKAIAEIYMKLPVYIPNVVNELLYLPKTESGEKEFSSLNYVQTENQNVYQVGEETSNEKEVDENVNE